jgi:hypothetical protein
MSEWVDYRKGKSRISSGPYILVYCPGHPHAKKSGHISEHRYLMEKKLGRFLSTSEHVHHKDGDGKNNDLENLELMNSSEHAREHDRANPEKLENGTKALKDYAARRKLERVEIPCACGCGMTLINRDSKGRLRRYVRGHNQTGKTWRNEKHE